MVILCSYCPSKGYPKKPIAKCIAEDHMRSLRARLSERSSSVWGVANILRLSPEDRQGIGFGEVLLRVNTRNAGCSSRLPSTGSHISCASKCQGQLISSVTE